MSLQQILSLLLLLSALLGSNALLGFLGGGNKAARTSLKEEILTLAEKTKRGLVIDQQQADTMQKLFVKLEKLNPTAKPLASSLVSGVWDLKYTTSQSILGSSFFPRIGPILQTLDTTKLTACNEELVDYRLFRLKRKVTAELKPISKSEVAVQFKQFVFGDNLWKVDAPEAFKGRLDVTYVDDDLRLSRGDKGNIFVLTRV